MGTFCIENIRKENLKIYNAISDKDIQDILEVVNSMNIEDLNEKNFKSFKYVSSGYFGDVYRYKNYAIKFFYRCDDNDDAENLSAVHHLISYPKLYLSHKKFMVVEFIEGKTLSICEDSTIMSLPDSTLKIFFNDLKTILENGIHPADLSEDNIILSKEGILKIIDVGCYDILYIKGSEQEYNYLKPYENDTNKLNLQERLLKDFLYEKTMEKLNLIGKGVLSKTA